MNEHEEKNNNFLLNILYDHLVAYKQHQKIF